MTGTGFVVNKKGYIVSCNHVVEGKSKIYCMIGQKEYKLDVVKKDSRNDIALLKMNEDPPSYVRFRSGKSIRPGENCIVLGFPLYGLLAQEVNVTTGSVSASSGPENDIRMLQITAPVHQGNSGGPMFDSFGNVSGVVIFKINALKLAKYIGDIPQNLNFVLNATIVKLFLDSNGIEYEENSTSEKMEPSDVVDQFKQSVVLIVAE